MTDKNLKKSNTKKSGRGDLPIGRWLIAQIFQLLRQYGGTIVWAGVCIYLIKVLGETVRAFAGRTSVARLALAVAARLNATVTVSVVLTGITGGLYLMEYRRHRKTRERLTQRITALELRLDPKRTSSGLTSEGTTRSGDL